MKLYLHLATGIFFNSSVLCSTELEQPRCLREPTICRLMEMTRITYIIENKMKADRTNMRKGLFLNSIRWTNSLLLFENRKTWWIKIFLFCLSLCSQEPKYILLFKWKVESFIYLINKHLSNASYVLSHVLENRVIKIWHGITPRLQGKELTDNLLSIIIFRKEENAKYQGTWKVK